MSGATASVGGRLAALVGGVVFGAGLVVSGMTEPQKVLAFLTIAPTWSPALMLVMGSALSVAAVGYALAKRRAAPLLALAFHSPTKTQIDTRLITGAGLFGVGWGIAGFCPGPAFVGAMTLDERALVFLLAFFVGLALYELWQQRREANLAPTATAADG